MAQFPYFGSFDFKTLTLSGPVTENNKTKVKVLNADGKVPYFNMAQYTGTPLRAKFAMDAPSADGDPDRRTQTVSVGDGDLLAAVRRFDAFVCRYAVDNSDKIFGKKMNLEQIEQRYERMEKTNEKFPGSYFKMKVKVGNSKVLTKLFKGGDKLYDDDDSAPRVDPSVLEESACSLSPIVSIPQIWIIGKGVGARFGAQIQAESAYVWAGTKRSACTMHSAYAAPEEEPAAKKQATDVVLQGDVEPKK